MESSNMRSQGSDDPEDEDSMSKKKPRQKFYEADLTQDIRYRGPLSYRYFRILGWLCLILSQVLVLVRMFGQLGVGTTDTIMMAVLNSVSALSVPFLLLANFATILDNTDGYKDQLLVNGVASGGIAIAFQLFYYHYVVGAASAFLGERKEALSMVEDVAYKAFSTHFLSFNLFLDLFLCSLFMLFLNYRPKKYFQGKRVIWFRLCAVLPVLYEAASLTLKGLSAMEKIRIPVSVYPFLTTKPPAMFLVFLVLAAFIKTREHHFCKNGRTHQEYMRFLKTNRNSLQFSRFTAIVLAVAAVADFLVFFILSIILSGGAFAEPDGAQQMTDITNKLLATGVGGSGMLLPMAPIVLLFSYTRTHRSKNIDYLIPVSGLIVILLIYLEAAYRGVCMLPQIVG